MEAVQDRVRDSVQSLFLSDVERGKKDDDHNRHRPGSAGLRTASVWSAVRIQPRRSIKKLLLLFFACLAVYLFIANIPTDLPVRDYRRPVYYPPGYLPPDRRGATKKVSDNVPIQPPHHGQPHAPPAARPGNKPPAQAAPAAPAAAAATYDAPPRFLELAQSLRAISDTRGGFAVNKNVLFVAASLKSITTLLPLACQMGSELRSYVHFAVMSKSEMSMLELQEVNGIDDTCNIFFHDARPEYASISTDTRMESGIKVAMSHIQVYMHPQAVIIDGTDAEEAYLTAGMRAYIKDNQTPLIELPRNSAKRLEWFTKLDSASLSNWNKISIDILIHAHAGASGSLIRLLKSMSAADFGGGSVPHVTIELPQKIDPPTEQFLESFQWPPKGFADTSGARQLSLRRRIPNHGPSEEDSSVRFLESFWPTRPQLSHVLVLSPQTELSQDFFHYVKYALLEYRYSNPALMQQWDKRLFSISLDLPQTSLDGETKLTPPAAPNPLAASQAAVADDPSSFLWQAPNSNAALFLGERWIELHQFVTRLLDARHALSVAEQEQLVGQKRVGKKYPSWLEHALQLCMARGFLTLYPSSTTASALATVHNELYKPPEEYEEDVMRSRDAAEDAAVEVHLGSKSLLETLPGGKGLAPFANLPLLTWDGKQAMLEEINNQVVAYAANFRRTTGGCSESILDTLSPQTLFCGNGNA